MFTSKFEEDPTYGYIKIGRIKPRMPVDDFSELNTIHVKSQEIFYVSAGCDEGSLYYLGPQEIIRDPDKYSKPFIEIRLNNNKENVLKLYIIKKNLSTITDAGRILRDEEKPSDLVYKMYTPALHLNNIARIFDGIKKRHMPKVKLLEAKVLYNSYMERL